MSARGAGVSLVTYAHRGDGLEFPTMSESTDISEVVGPTPHLEQVDPPHPFQSIFKTLVIAAILVTIALGLYVYLAQKPPVASGEVLTTTVYPIHTVLSNGGGTQEGMAGSAESYDQLLVLSKIRIRNQTDIPLFLQDIRSAIKLPDGSEQENVSASDNDMNRVFQAYPSLSYLRSPTIGRDITLTPGQFAEGLVIFNYPITKEQWDKLQSAKVVVSFMHQKNLELNISR
jgi:hypothetical protein